MSKVIIILGLFNKYAPDKQLMTIRNTDTSKRPQNTADEYAYAQFCNEAKEQAGIGTQDAMRKNIFVDLHRMGLIERYSNNKSAIETLSRCKVKYVSLTDQGVRLITEKNELSQYYIFSKGIDKLLGGYINIILNMLRDEEYKLSKKISIYEFMFFVSAIGTDTTFNISTDKCVELIKSYRNLTSIQRRNVIEQLKTNLRPKNFSGNKNSKRDYHNWHNKAAQVYTLLNQTVYFDIRDETLFLRKHFGKNSCIEIEQPNRLDRSLNEKYQYFINHKVKKTKGFELHHVVPLAWSESIYQFKLLDNWLNMVYIDALSHARITQNRNRNVVMSFNGSNLLLKDHEENEVNLEKDKNILYEVERKQDMLSYNGKLLHSIK